MQYLCGLLLSVFCISVFCLKTWAFTYQLDSETFSAPSLSERYELREVFAKAGYYSLSLRNLNKLGLPFDGAFVSEDWNRAILLKAGLKSPASVGGRLLHEKSLGLSAFHFRFRGTPYVLVALNVPTDELARLVAPWRSSSASLFRTFFFPQAHAETLKCHPQRPATKELERTAEFISNNEILKNIGQCGLEAIQGLQSSHQEILNQLKSLSADPKKLWLEMKNSFLELKEFALQFQSDLQNLFKTLGSLSPEEKSQIACTLMGSLIVKTAQNAVLPGGLLKLLPSLSMKLRELGELLSSLRNLENLGFQLPAKTHFIEEALTCVK